MNALFSVCWAVIKKVSTWQNFDLDKILIEGDKICKLLHKDEYLAFDGLPKQLQIYNCDVHIGIEAETVHKGIASCRETFLGNILYNFTMTSTG